MGGDELIHRQVHRPVDNLATRVSVVPVDDFPGSLGLPTLGQQRRCPQKECALVALTRAASPTIVKISFHGNHSSEVMWERSPIAAG
jgi:hypothetical protein